MHKKSIIVFEFSPKPSFLSFDSLADGQKDLKPFTISTISRGGLGSKGVKLSGTGSSGARRSTRSSTDTRKEEGGEK